MKHKLMVVSGPAGVGKGTIVKTLTLKREDVVESVSCTTRSPRVGEVDGKHYFFITKEEFLRRIEEKDFLEYERNKQLRRAVERELEIIGEAVNHLLALDESIAIDKARRIVDLRNFVIHGYDKVDNVIIWGVISRDLPKLKQQVDKLMEEQTIL